jgi:hypothetical protein
MEHPTYEELLAHIEGASSSPAARKVANHVQHCTECAAEIAGWQRTIKKLDQHEWPNSQWASAGSFPTVMKWAIAAAAVFLLAIGFGLGRVSEMSNNRLRQTLAAQVKQQVENELKAELLATFSPPNSGGGSKFQQQLRGGLLSTLNANQNSKEKQRLLKEIQQVLAQKQDENQRILLDLVYQVRQAHEADYLSLRHDLETAASVADNDLEENRQQLSHLAATLLAKNQN